MANVNLIIVNPTDATVTVNSQNALAREATLLVIDDTTSDAYGFLAAGCAVVSADAGTAETHEQNGYLMDRLARFA